MRLTQQTPEQLEKLAGKALILLGELYYACMKRRNIEAMCGYSDVYGNDKEILEKAIEFMGSQGNPFLKEVSETVKNLLDKSSG